MSTVPPCRAAAALVLAALLCCGGCAPWRDTPRSRLGALPCPGPFTLYEAADPRDLGRHRYRQVPRFFRQDEKERGIIYTTRGGFVDLAHVRIATDWTRYYVRAVRRAMAAGETKLVLPGMNRAGLHVTLNHPPPLAGLDPRARAAVEAELAMRTGQRLAYLMLTWHELITWFGYRTVFFVDESPSAFTYDDTMSHVVGLRVAERALRDPWRRYDDAVTAALSAELHALGAVAPRRTDRAVRAVEGVWWARGKPLKRQFNVGLREFVVYPWLVRGLPFAPDAEPEPFYLPRLNDVFGHDLSGFFAAEIDPRICEAPRMRKYLPGGPRRFSRERDIPILHRVVRDQMRRNFGPDVNQPYPGADADPRSVASADAGTIDHGGR